MTITQLESIIQANFNLPAHYIPVIIPRVMAYDLAEISESDLVELIDNEVWAIDYKPGRL